MGSPLRTSRPKRDTATRNCRIQRSTAPFLFINENRSGKELRPGTICSGNARPRIWDTGFYALLFGLSLLRLRFRCRVMCWGIRMFFDARAEGFGWFWSGSVGNGQGLKETGTLFSMVYGGTLLVNCSKSLRELKQARIF